MGIDAVAQTRAALVEHDQARERTKPRHQMAESGIFPVCIKIGDETWNEDQIQRLIGDTDIPALGVTRFW